MSIATPEIMQTVGENYLVRHPEGMPIMWRRVTIETILSGQPHAYADSVYEYLVTFEGGISSSIDSGEAQRRADEMNDDVIARRLADSMARR